ncbi:potassium transporter 7 isoform X2 [Gossypium hirsutum]|uniref:Potassium transporter 7 isoform X2 n=1 Tax=Gossypium hirsutum TaxID=3635 RepID=A0ABM3BKE9_GOSHI|nr:potassium transporter 7-like isoform X2 [Gossypium hirsutum]
MAEEVISGSGSSGREGEINIRVGLTSRDSLDSRWVFPGEDDFEIEDNGDGDDDLPHRAVVDSEDEDNQEHRLIRTEPRVDSFDVEALEVHGAHRSDYEDLGIARRIIHAFQTLGVVFGDVGTSPLYTFSVMFSKAPIKGDEDVIGALSLVLYTLLLVPLVKYVLIVLWANNDGEGGTFALYSLICQHAKVSLLPNQLPSDTRISNFILKLPSPELERSLKIKERLEASLTLKKLLLVLVLAGTSMVIADGVVTPAMSVMSAVGGLKVGVAAIEQDEVVMISVTFLVILFSVQKFGTSQVGLAVGPALFIWFCSLAGIGIYNLIKYDASVLRAFNPVHIYLYFKRNSVNAWYALGGCLLCATGSEAMFADLCYFSVRSIQLTFVFLVLPCLLLGYLGQAAYLTGNLNGAEKHPFFLSIPSIAELGVMMMTTILVTIVMLLIWQLNIIIVLSFVVFFLGLELTFFSSVLWSVTDGSWVILVFAVIMFVIMYIWNYGSKLKYETEVERKLPMDLMREIGCNLGTIRAPGIGLLYNELAKGVPAIFGHFITTLPAIHSMIIFVCIKYVPVPVVPQNERFFFRRICPKSYHLFRCIARYGYKDVRKENHQAFEQLLMESLEKFIRREAQQRQLESDGDEDADSEEDTSFSRVLVDPNGSVYSLGVPLLAEFRGSSNSISEASISEEVNPSSPASPSISDAEHSLERELSFIRQAKESGVVYLLGHGDIRARKDSWFIKKLVINYFYAFLRKNCRRGIANLSVPHSHLIQVGMTYMV